MQEYPAIRRCSTCDAPATARFVVHHRTENPQLALDCRGRYTCPAHTQPEITKALGQLGDDERLYAIPARMTL
jgi:hypothetical protein